MKLFFGIVLLLIIFNVCIGFRLSDNKCSFKPMKMSLDKKLVNSLDTTSKLVLLTPFSVLADSGSQNAFIFPLAISFLTIVPFILYQQ
jgi:hypothetical protein